MNRFHITASPSNEDIPALEAMRNTNEWTLDGPGGERVIIMGRLMGFGSSRRPDHRHLRGPLSENSYSRCSACRWFEVRILHVEQLTDATPGPYLVHTLGPSVVPGERTFVRLEFAVSPFEVIELCTVRQGERGEPYMPAAAARALSQAAGVDSDIADAYVNRAVA